MLKWTEVNLYIATKVKTKNTLHLTHRKCEKARQKSLHMTERLGILEMEISLTKFILKLCIKAAPQGRGWRERKRD